MGFVANGNTTATHEVFRTNTFFPEVSMHEIREIIKVDGSVTDARLKQVVFEEIVDVNRLLDQIIQPNISLRELSKTEINGKSDREILYFSAISNGVAAKVCEKYRGYDSTNTGNKRAEDLTLTIDEYRRNKHWAIQQLIGKNQATVDLI